MLRAKLAGRVNYPGSLHLNGWMPSALARRTQHQFREEGEANRKFWAGGAWHCFELILWLLCHSWAVCICACAKEQLPHQAQFACSSFSHHPLGISLQVACWLLCPGSCFWHKEHLSRAFLSLLPAALSSAIVSGPHWNEGSGHLQLSSNLPLPLEWGQQHLLPNSSSNLTCITRGTEVSKGPWESLGMKVILFFYFQQLSWKQLVLHELFAFQS